MRRRKAILACAMLLATTISLQAQNNASDTTKVSLADTSEVSNLVKPKKAWELGIGVDGMNIVRFNVYDFKLNNDGGYTLGASKKDFIFGGQIYAAKELCTHFYLDMQGVLNYAKDPVAGGKKERIVAMGGLGLQWRLGEYFNSRYIDPFLRVGGNYMYKNFSVAYNGLEQFEDVHMSWQFSNDFNKEGADRKHLLNVAFGAGINMWLNDRFGIGMQADYLYVPYKNIANVWQGAVRLIWRIGGKTKKSYAPAPVQYVEKIVERVVEKPVIVEKVVEKVIEKHSELLDLFKGIYFVFDKSDITEESKPIIDKIAEIMKNYDGEKFLITGFTDVRGTDEYNIALSLRRAKTVVEALIDRGVPAQSLKYRGVGKRVSYAPYGASDIIRKGDRKITVEVITNMDYWNYLKNK